MLKKARLVVVGGLSKTREIPLRLPAVIGRGRDVTIQVAHPLVSRRHCELYLSDGKLYVRDLGSLNGTFVGSERVEEAPLPSGELLTIGTITFRVLYEDSEVPNTPAEDSTTSNYVQKQRDRSSGQQLLSGSESRNGLDLRGDTLEVDEPVLPPSLEDSSGGT